MPERILAPPPASPVADRERGAAINAGTQTSVGAGSRGVAGYSAVENYQDRATAVTVDEDSAADVSRVVICQQAICYGRGYVLV